MRAPLLLFVISLSMLTPTVATASTPKLTNSDGSPKHLPPGPPAIPHKTAIFTYEDFGPQSMAGKVLGPQWWQWATCACFEPDDQFEIRVVVYRGVSLAQLERRYPTIENRADYRYLEYTGALAYLDAQIAELAEMTDDFDFGPLIAELRETRRRVRRI